MRRALALGLIVAVLGLPACDLFGGDPEPSSEPSVPAAGDRSPVPGQPPIVWVGGLLQEIAENRLTVLGGSEDPAVLQRLAGGATRFLVADGDAWRELGEDEAAGISVGRRVCAEVLLDGSNLVALRVFLDAECGPTGAAP
ncbi:MAG: hypothetical protein WD770_09705 [Actinomycetota bacterium]